MAVPKGFVPLDQLDKTNGQKRLNGWLASRCFCTGFTPAPLDNQVLAALGGFFNDKSSPNVFRWAKHVLSYSAEERASWGQATEAPAAPAAKKPAKKAKKDIDDVDDLFDDDDSDDVDDLFGDDDEGEDIADTIARKIAADKELQARMKMKAEKAKKKGPEKTMFVFDVKPFDTETDLEALAKALKATTRDGIVCWGQEHKFLPVAFGIKKLRISMIVEDDKICQDDMEDHMNADGRDDLIQSIDLYTMSKV